MPRLALVLLVGPLLSACHTYTPVTLSEVGPDMPVRVQIADRPTSPPVEGRVIEVESGQAGFTLLPEIRRGGPGDPLFVPSANIQGIEQREIDGTRTGLLIAGTALAGVGALLLIQSNPSSTTPRPGGGVFIRIPAGP